MYERERTEDDGDREEELLMKRRSENKIKGQLLTIDILPEVFEELKNIGGKNKVIFFQWKIEGRVTDKILKILTDDDKARLCEELEGMTKDGSDVLRNEQTKELNNDKEITLRERKKRGEDQDDFGVVKSFLQQMKRKEEEQKALFGHIKMKCEHECFEILPKVAAMKYLEHMKRKGNITYENGISEEVSSEKETKILENNGETTEKQQGSIGGANSLDVLKQEDDDSDLDDLFEVLNKEHTSEYLEEVRKNEEDERKHFEWWKAEHENDICGVLPLERETHLLYENNGETREKQQGNLGGTNSLDVLKQEMPRKDEMIFSFDPMNTYSKLLINGVNKENANTNTLLKEIVNELMGTKKKVVNNSSSMEKVRGIRSDSASNYCIVPNIDTGFFHHSNSETAMKLNHFYTKIRRFPIPPSKE